MPTPPAPFKPLHLALWGAQALLALGLLSGASMKLALSIDKLAAMWPWAGEHPTLVRLTGVIDLLGGIGLVVPALTRIRPGLTVLAALSCAVLQVCAIGFHVARGEAANTPFNFILLALALFVFWGRRKKAPIRAKGE